MVPTKTVVRYLLILVALAVLLIGAATQAGRISTLLASSLPTFPASGARAATSPRTGSLQTLLANPAAVYCRDLGYSFEDVDDGAGGKKGICVMPNQARCDAWDFLAGKCGPEYSYCAQQGHGLRVEADGKNPFSQEYAVCLDKDGKNLGAATDLDGIPQKVKSSNCTTGSTAGNGPQSDVLGGSGPLVEDPAIQQMAASAGAPPASFDWRNATYLGATGNWLTPVKDQAYCGSCWAFGAVGQTEAVLKIASGNPGPNPDLAEDYLVSDCTSAGTCCGGWPASALSYIQTYGIPDEACMPYADAIGCYPCPCPTGCKYHTGESCSNHTCSDRCANYASRLVKIRGYGYVGTDRKTIKQALVIYGPLSVAFDVSHGTWVNGVMQCPAPQGTDHAVDLVGYNDAGGYWIARNSWGSGWNGDGYFKIGYGQCYIESYVYYATASVTHVISGYVRRVTGTPVSGVVIDGLPFNPVTNGSGFYSAAVPNGFSGTVTPLKVFWAFDPASRNYASVTSDTPNQNYTAFPPLLIPLILN